MSPSFNDSWGMFGSLSVGATSLCSNTHVNQQACLAVQEFQLQIFLGKLMFLQKQQQLRFVC